MRPHVFQHVSFEGLGHIEPWLLRSGFPVSFTRFFEDPALPDPDTVDFLIILGGPMGVHDEIAFPWLAEEKSFIRRFLATGKPALGICLGAQLIADALGARVRRNPEKEIGWYPIEGLPPLDPAAFRFPPSAHVFHWHGDTFDLPPGAVHLAKSQACEIQAFQIGSAIGLQFHLETTPESVRALIDHARAELLPGPYVQSEAELTAVSPDRYLALHRILDELLAHLFPATRARLR